MIRTLTCGTIAAAIMAFSIPTDAATPESIKSSPRKITPVSETIITTPGEGEMINPAYGSSSRTWLLYNMAPASMNDNDGYAVRLVNGTDDVYIYNFCSEFQTGSWIKGTAQSDGTVRFSLPQKVYHRDAGNGMSEADYYLARLTPKISSTGEVVLTVDDSDCDLVMKWEDGILTQVMPEAASAQLERYTGIVGLVAANGNFSGFGEQGVSYRSTAYSTASPDESGLNPRRYTLHYTDGNNSQTHANVSIAISGNDAWIQGMNPWLPEVWVKGSADDDGITIPTQYAGETHNYLTFLAASEGGGLLPQITLRKTGADYVAAGTFCINLGDRRLNPSVSFSGAVLTPYEEGDRTPANPTDFEPEQYTDNEGLGLLYFVLPDKDTDGNALDTQKLYYNVFIDGDIHTLTPAEYGVAEDMTDIPYGFENDFIIPTGDGGIIFCFFRKVDSIGIRALYKGDSGTTYSDTVTHYFEEVGVENTTTDQTVSTEYYDLHGRKAGSLDGGILIKVSRMADGSVRTEKRVMPR